LQEDHRHDVQISSQSDRYYVSIDQFKTIKKWSNILLDKCVQIFMWISKIWWYCRRWSTLNTEVMQTYQENRILYLTSCHYRPPDFCSHLSDQMSSSHSSSLNFSYLIISFNLNLILNEAW